ncbi:phage tail protein [Azohydromonas aeria]|uniref:phage tail protein n=1 Tax=Azohydromonas aeria TaxID=2590212 RepID=UPI001E533939|nr:tail fiber protein [Azohydromonas aeria]
MEPFIGEIRIFSGNFPPRGWATCDGQLLSIAQNTALFSLLGTAYGGDGRVTFGLPDLRGRVPVHASGTLPMGQAAGSETVTLSSAQLPVHAHAARAAALGDSVSPAGRYWAAEPNAEAAPYSNTHSGQTLAPAALAPSGGNQPHDNMQPFLAMNFIIALEGIYPMRP